MRCYCSKNVIKIYVVTCAVLILCFEHFATKFTYPTTGTGGLFWKKVFLKILQISQENICVGVCNFIKKRLQHRCFAVKLTKFLGTPILQNICERLLPSLTNIATVHQVVRITGNYDKLISEVNSNINRSSHWRCSVRKDVLEKFAKLTGKRLYQSLFFNKVSGLSLWHMCFPVNFAKFLRTPFLWIPPDDCFCINCFEIIMFILIAFPGDFY